MTDQPDCLHHLSICPECDGLDVVRLDRLKGVTNITLNIEGPTGPQDLTGFTAVYIGPGPTPCPNSTEDTQ